MGSRVGQLQLSNGRSKKVAILRHDRRWYGRLWIRSGMGRDEWKERFGWLRRSQCQGQDWVAAGRMRRRERRGAEMATCIGQELDPVAGRRTDEDETRKARPLTAARIVPANR